MEVAVMNLAIKQQTIQVMVFAVDVPEDVDVLLASAKRKRDAEGIRVRISEESVFTDEFEGGPAFQHGGLIVNDDGHKKAVVS